MMHYTIKRLFVIALFVAIAAACQKTTEASFVTIEPVIKAGDTIHFKNTSANASSYIWRFGDGAVSNQVDAEHVFSQPGNYTVSLTAVSANNKQQKVYSKVVAVAGVSLASFQGNYVCSQSCNNGSQTYTMQVVIQGTGLLMVNSYDIGGKIFAFVSGNAITMPIQGTSQSGTWLLGSGSYYNDTLAYSYYVTDGIDTNSCAVIAIKQ